MAEFVCPEEEIVLDHVIQPPINDNKKLSLKEYREALYKDIAAKKREQRKKWQQKYLAQFGLQESKPSSQVVLNQQKEKENKEHQEQKERQQRQSELKESKATSKKESGTPKQPVSQGSQ